MKKNPLIFISNVTHDHLYDIHQNKICMAEHVVGFLIQIIFRCICIWSCRFSTFHLYCIIQRRTLQFNSITPSTETSLCVFSLKQAKASDSRDIRPAAAVSAREFSLRCVVEHETKWKPSFAFANFRNGQWLRNIWLQRGLWNAANPQTAPLLSL